MMDKQRQKRNGGMPPSVPCPPSSRDPLVRMLYPLPGVPVVAVAVADTVYGLLSHWWDMGPVPCFAIVGDCFPCSRGQKARWYGYLNCVEFTSRRRRVLVITEAGYRCCPGLLRLEGKLRGHCLRLSRIGLGRNAPVKVEVTNQSHDFDLPQNWSVEDTLSRFWGLTPPKGGVETVNGIPCPSGAEILKNTEKRRENGDA